MCFCLCLNHLCRRNSAAVWAHASAGQPRLYFHPHEKGGRAVCSAAGQFLPVRFVMTGFVFASLKFVQGNRGPARRYIFREKHGGMADTGTMPGCRKAWEGRFCACSCRYRRPRYSSYSHGSWYSAMSSPCATYRRLSFLRVLDPASCLFADRRCGSNTQ